MKIKVEWIPDGNPYAVEMKTVEAAIELAQAVSVGGDATVECDDSITVVTHKYENGEHVDTETTMKTHELSDRVSVVRDGTTYRFDFKRPQPVAATRFALTEDEFAKLMEVYK